MKHALRTSRRSILGVVCLMGCAIGAIAARVDADVKLNAIFGDHMVLQREAAVPVWGRAQAGEKVTVSFAGQKKEATADAAGKWTARLDAMPASAEAREMIVSGENSTIVLPDILVGEVWLAGGQSNMGLPVSAAHNAAEALAQADDSQFRLFKVAMKTAAEPQENVSGEWKLSASATAKDFSAAAYFFGKELRQKLGCPVGMIAAPWGGTPIQTWISLRGIQKDPPLKRTLDDWNKALEQYQKVKANPKLVEDYLAELKAWQHDVAPSYNAAVKAYNEAKAAGKAVGDKPKPATPEPTNPDPMGTPSPSRRPQTPGVSFNAMIAPLAPYAIRGAIWYQGEANGSAGIEYRDLFPRMIEDWRSYWGCDFPFLFVQLPANGPDSAPVAESGWPWLREAQFMTLREPHTAMAITIDVGNPNDVHPADKIDVGHRLALLARRDVYREKIVASGPLYKDFAVESGAIRVHFTETGSGLAPGQAPWLAPRVQPLPTDRLIGFFIAGEDRKWAPAEARIDGDSVIVSSPAVPSPAAVRYGWANSPRCNLYNREGLPASPFRTDRWENDARGHK